MPANEGGCCQAARPSLWGHAAGILQLRQMTGFAPYRKGPDLGQGRGLLKINGTAYGAGGLGFGGSAWHNNPKPDHFGPQLGPSYANSADASSRIVHVHKTGHSTNQNQPLASETGQHPDT